MEVRRVAAIAALLALAMVGGMSRADTPPVGLSGAAGRVALDGPWILRSDHHNAGLRRGWARGGFAGSRVTIPYAPNARPDRLHPPALMPAFEGTIAWYRTTFEVPADGDYALDFGSVNHKAKVWVDGRLRARHVGPYLPFAAPFHARAGRHTLVVRADYRDPLQMKLDGWHRTWFNFGGITRGVTLRPLGRSDLLVPTATTTLRRDGSALVRLSVHVRNRDVRRPIRVSGELRHGAQRVPFAFAPARIGPGDVAVLRTTVRVPDPALWSPEQPNLYELDLAVPGESAWRGRTGLRQLTWRGRALFVNGRRVRLRGACVPEDAYGRGDALRARDMDRLVEHLKAIGANATRSQHPLSPALLDRLDEAGIMVWQGVGPIDAPGAFREDTPARQRLARERTLTSYRELQLHPSIIAWSLANEVAFAGHPGGQAAYIDRMARELHRRDPGRMVGVDVWGAHPPDSDRGLLLYRHLDVVGLTNYIGWYENVHLRGARLVRAVRAKVRSFARAFPDKVVMVTEFGAEGNAANPAGAPGGYAFQQRLLADHIRAYAREPELAGMLIWSLRDFEVTPHFLGGSIRHQVPDIRIRRGLNSKGLFSYAGRPKPAVAVVRRLYRRLAAR
jgi:hypothetical protein